MVNFYNDYVTCQKTAKLSDVAGEQQRGLAPTRTSIAPFFFFSPLMLSSDHFDYIKKVAGAEIIGFGGDYDGVTR